MESLAKLIESIKDWRIKNPEESKELSHEIEIDHEGWIQLKDREINVVKEIQKNPNLKYKLIKNSEDFYNTKYTVQVTNEVGELIELYMKNDSYAGFELSEFLDKTANVIK